VTVSVSKLQWHDEDKCFVCGVTVSVSKLQWRDEDKCFVCGVTVAVSKLQWRDEDKCFVCGVTVSVSKLQWRDEDKCFAVAFSDGVVLLSTKDGYMLPIIIDAHKVTCSRPNKAHLKCPSMHSSIRTSVRPQNVSSISMKFGT